MTSMWQTPYPDKYITRIYLFMYLSEYWVCHIDVISSGSHAKSLSFVKFSTIRPCHAKRIFPRQQIANALKNEPNKEPRSSLYLEQFGNVSHLHLQQVQISKRGRAVVEYMNIKPAAFIPPRELPIVKYYVFSFSSYLLNNVSC